MIRVAHSPPSPARIRSRLPDAAVYPGLLSAAAFDALARDYLRASGFVLTALDAAGRPQRAAHGRGTSAPPVPEVGLQAVSETLRWGEPSVVCGPEDRVWWAVPVMCNQQVVGGLLAGGIELRRPRRAGALDQRVRQACQLLLEKAVAHNLTNGALLAERRRLARREREKAEAIHELKHRLHDDIRSTYLHEEPALLAAIRRGERPEARRILNRVLTAIFAVGQSNTTLLKSLALELVVMMTRAAVQAGGNPEKILGLNYQSLTALARVEDLEPLSSWLCDMLEQLIDAIEVNTRHPNSVLLARALDYLESNLAKDVNRNAVARSVGLSASHFSRLMRAKTGWTFTELVTRLRVDRACHLLAHTDLGLAHIALESGFGDQSYFSRVFRRRLGATPGAYRRQRQREAQKS